MFTQRSGADGLESFAADVLLCARAVSLCGSPCAASSCDRRGGTNRVTTPCCFSSGYSGRRPYGVVSAWYRMGSHPHDPDRSHSLRSVACDRSSTSDRPRNSGRSLAASESHSVSTCASPSTSPSPSSCGTTGTSRAIPNVHDVARPRSSPCHPGTTRRSIPSEAQRSSSHQTISPRSSMTSASSSPYCYDLRPPNFARSSAYLASLFAISFCIFISIRFPSRTHTGGTGILSPENAVIRRCTNKKL